MNTLFSALNFLWCSSLSFTLNLLAKYSKFETQSLNIATAQRKTSAQKRGGRMKKRLIISTSVTFTIILLLIFAFPASALTIDITEPSPKTLGQTINFSFTITIEDTELLPIQSVNLEIYNEADPTTYLITCSDLPLTATTKTYPMSGGTVVVEAIPAAGWAYGYGYGYVQWMGLGYYFGYKYGYGYGPATQSITYNVSWSSLDNWPAGDYIIKAEVVANGQTFSKTRTIALTKALAPAVPDFSVSVSPTSGLVVRGESTTVTVSVSSIAGFAELVSLSVTGLPSGASASFIPSSGTPSFTSTMTISTSTTTPTGTYTLTITGSGGGRTHSRTYELTVTAIPLENILEMTLEDAAKYLATLDPEEAGKIIDAGVEEGLTNNFAQIVSKMDASDAASILLKANPFSAARVMESILRTEPEVSAKIAAEGAKLDLTGEASILDEMRTEYAKDLLIEIYELPATPETAGKLLGAMRLERGTGVVRALIRDEKFSYVDGMFSYLTDVRLNQIFGQLTLEERDELLLHLSPEVKNRISPELLPPIPFPWMPVIGIIVVIIIIIAVMVSYMRRR
jgi:flagellar motility protein MotE (MotC chaperone)